MLNFGGSRAWRKKKQNGVSIARTQMNTWMPVTIKPGLFPTERTVQFNDADGKEIAIFVSSGQVDDGKNKVLVLVLEQNKEHALVRVPARGGTTVAKVVVAKVVKEGICAA